MKQEEIIKEAEEYVDSWIRYKPALKSARGYLIRTFIDGANWAFNPLSKFMGHYPNEVEFKRVTEEKGALWDNYIVTCTSDIEQ